MRALMLLCLFAGCASSKLASPDPLVAPRNESWPEGWRACSEPEIQQVVRTRPREAAEECSLGYDACVALRAELTVCSHLEPNRVALLVSTDAAGKVTGKCVAAATGPAPAATLACLEKGLAAITAPPSLSQSVVRIELEPFVVISNGTGLASSMILDTISGQLGRIERCVEQHQAESSVRGKLIMKWQIAADGTVSNARTTPETFDGTPAQSCLVEVFSGMRFPKHTTPAQEPVVFPIKL